MRGKPVLFIPASALSRLPRARYEGCSPTPKNLARRPQLISCPWGPARCARAAQRAAAELRCCSLGSVRLWCPDSLGIGNREATIRALQRGQNCWWDQESPVQMFCSLFRLPRPPRPLGSAPGLGPLRCP